MITGLNWYTFKRGIWSGRGRRLVDGPNPDVLKQLARGIATTRPDEIACDQCFELLDRLAQATVAGQSTVQVMPLVKDHLDRCNDCGEEFEALLVALRSVT